MQRGTRISGARMENVKLRKLVLVNGKLPGPVDLVVADYEKREEATIWIEARFQLEDIETTDATLVLYEALNRLRELAHGAEDNLGSVSYI